VPSPKDTIPLIFEATKL